jgi:uncharacterized membrane protein YphA (DoxX/SURF4 family)/thiol-disulfide isomerase/thioredoxin
MKTVLQNKWLILVLRLILGTIFVVAAVSKLQNITNFINTVASYEILNYHLSTIYGYLVPLGELIIGCVLILGVFVKFAAALSIPLLISFMVASSYAIANSAGGACGCFGTFLALSHQLALTIDILMLAGAVVLFLNNATAFMNIGYFTKRLKMTPAVFRWTGRAFLIALIIVYAAVETVQLTQFFNRPAYDILAQIKPEVIAIPAPLSADVDVSLANNKPILMEFYVDTCQLCQAAAPTVYAMADEFPGRVTLMRLNYYDYYQNNQLVSDMHLHTIPTVLVISGKNSDGKYIVTGYLESVIPQAELQAILQRAVNGR